MTDLPIETEFIEGEWYYNTDRKSETFRYVSGRLVDINGGRMITCAGRIVRLAPATEYRPAPAEPTGLGAVVRDARGYIAVRVHEMPDRGCWYYHGRNSWSSLRQPVEVLSEGVADV